MKKLLTLSALLMASFTAQSAMVELYQVDQLLSGSSISQDVRPTIKIAPSSGLPKMHCKILDRNGDQITSQNVTVFEEYDLFVLVEVNLYNDQHLQVDQVVCL